ncbi:isopentenyl-diphosphate Delta-isomerase [Escherichia coli]
MGDVILIGHNDCETGIAEKLYTHKKCILHRAVYVYIYNSNGELFLQKKALGKYYSLVLWSNMSCTHPFPGESNLSAANRRLREEMGIECPLSKLLKIYYNVYVGGDLTEHEIAHIFYGVSDDEPVLNSLEAMSYKYVSLTELSSEIKFNNDAFSRWFIYCFPYIKNAFLNESNYTNLSI